MSTSELTPKEKAKRTRLVNEGIRLAADKAVYDARLDEIKKELWKQAEVLMAASGAKNCTFATRKGRCDITSAMLATIPAESEKPLKKALGDRFEKMVKEERKFSLTAVFRSLLSKPNPADVKLADRVRELIKMRTVPRLNFKRAD